MCALRSHAFHAIERFAERALVVKQKTHHDGKEAPMLHTTHGVSVDGSGIFCAKLSMAIFLAKCRDNCQNNLRRLRQNKQATIFQHCRHAAFDQRAFMHTTASKSFHGDSVANASNNTHQRPSTTNDTRPHKNKHTQANKEWLVGSLVGTEQKLLENPTCLSIFQKKCLIPLDKVLLTLNTLQVLHT